MTVPAGLCPSAPVRLALQRCIRLRASEPATCASARLIITEVDGSMSATSSRASSPWSPTES